MFQSGMTAFILMLLCAFQVRDPDFRLGRVIISGNTATPDKVITGALGLAPGRLTNARELREAEARLRALRHFYSNPWRGIGPTVRVRSADTGQSEYLDVYVDVEEPPGRWIGYELVGLFESINDDRFDWWLEHFIRRLNGFFD